MKIVNKTNKKQFLALTALTVLGCTFAQPCKSMNALTKNRMDVLIKQMQPQTYNKDQDPYIIINGIKLKYDRSEYNGKTMHAFPSFENYWNAVSKICKNIDKNNEMNV